MPFNAPPPNSQKLYNEIDANQSESLNDSIPEIKVKTAFNGQIYVTYIANTVSFSQFEDEMRDICGFTPGNPFTVKWVDEEGDPCTISSQVRPIFPLFRLLVCTRASQKFQSYLRHSGLNQNGQKHF